MRSYAQFGVMFFPDKAKSYQEVNRVLAPGGRYLFNVWDLHRHNPFAGSLDEVAGSFFPANSSSVLQRTVLSIHQIDPIKGILDRRRLRLTSPDCSRQVGKKNSPNVELFAEAWSIGNPVPTKS